MQKILQVWFGLFNPQFDLIPNLFQAVFWHSSAHILGEAMERVYGGHLCYGPPIENGFYYDMYSPDRNVSFFYIFFIIIIFFLPGTRCRNINVVQVEFFE
jgi:hypothetical protein